MPEKYGWDAWDAEQESLSDDEIKDTIRYADTICGIWGRGQKMDSWEKEHFALIARHQMTWREYRPMHLRHVAMKNGIKLDDNVVDHMFERDRG